MFGGFDPRTQSLFFRRRRTASFIVATILYATVLALALREQPAEETVEVELEPEIQDFAVEEEPEPEPEEPPPPPPPNTKVEIVDKPKPRPRPKIEQPIEKPTDAAEETDTEKVVEVGAGAGPSDSTGTRPVNKKSEGKPKPPPPEKKVEPKGPSPKKIDPTKPIDRPEQATMPKPDPSNTQPEYPKELRDEGITGQFVLEIHIHRDGTVRGAKILRKQNSATTEEDKARANKLFLAAVIKVVKNWKYTPAKLNGQPISIWFPVTVPFLLTAG